MGLQDILSLLFLQNGSVLILLLVKNGDDRLLWVGSRVFFNYASWDEIRSAVGVKCRLFWNIFSTFWLMNGCLRKTALRSMLQLSIWYSNNEWIVCSALWTPAGFCSRTEALACSPRFCAILSTHEKWISMYLSHTIRQSAFTAPGWFLSRSILFLRLIAQKMKYNAVFSRTIENPVVTNLWTDLRATVSPSWSQYRNRPPDAAKLSWRCWKIFRNYRK